MGAGEVARSVLNTEYVKGIADLCPSPWGYTSAFTLVVVDWTSPPQAPEDKDFVS